jgi:5-carboxymethyl-2-hydroxymuconate isomerase
MPHLIIEHSANLPCDTTALMETVYHVAASSGVMAAGDIKVRALPYASFRLHQHQRQFVHVSCRLLAGRSSKQKVALSEQVRAALVQLLPKVYSISVEIIDMEPKSYKKRVLDE